MSLPTINREDLRFRILKELGGKITSEQAKETIDLLVTILAAAILNSERIIFTNVGVLQPHFKKERPGTNPRTGKFATVLARVSYTFNLRSRAGCLYPKISTHDLAMRMWSNAPWLNQRNATKVIHIFLKELAAVRDGKQRIELRGLGSFNPKVLEAVNGCNPDTGERFVTKPKQTIKFKLGTSIKDLLIVPF